MFNGILIEKDEQGYRASVQALTQADLPQGDVLVKVDYSTLNYKDALAITGKGPIVRSFPMVPGIDFAGVVEQSEHADFTPGQRVILNGWGVGEQHWGGLAQYARVKADWLIHAPDGMSNRHAMAIGTAGYTAMLCVIALEKAGIRPDAGDVVVTGANGGVGSFAIAILHKLGYRVVAATGRPDESGYLSRLGASEIIDRATLSAPGKPLQKERWAAGIDSVGSHTLANLCASIKADGAVTACGMAQGLDLPASVAPFILRGVSLLGINSVTRPRSERIHAWNRLATDLPTAIIDSISRDITLGDAMQTAQDLMAGKVQGRVVVDVNQ
ncbi:MDR family oxidoreductase [Achromobacter sp. JUb104]|uniref:acrylyl-CoA reductase (NADPH) n=1 Tax=Achromobacter sp. JUb104 TaxID=2940590 RepID=UPI002167582D|nr:MDR family oxidoreductase [Achromobacter sp. JUb104]MCS3504300.1 acrylyl-CoA reductase (NADPH) [Achromobacter sp. JUb104]